MDAYAPTLYTTNTANMRRDGNDEDAPTLSDLQRAAAAAKQSSTTNFLANSDLQKLDTNKETDVSKNVELVRYLASVTGFHKTLRRAIWGELFAEEEEEMMYNGDFSGEDEEGGNTYGTINSINNNATLARNAAAAALGTTIGSEAHPTTSPRSPAAAATSIANAAVTVPKELAILFDAQHTTAGRKIHGSRGVVVVVGDDEKVSAAAAAAGYLSRKGEVTTTVAGRRRRSSSLATTKLSPTLILGRDITSLPSTKSMCDVRISNVTGVVDMSDPRLWDPPVPVISKSRQSRVLHLQRRSIVLKKQRSRFVRSSSGTLVPGGQEEEGDDFDDDDDGVHQHHHYLGVAGTHAAYEDFKGGQDAEVSEAQMESSGLFLSQLDPWRERSVCRQQRRHSSVLPPLNRLIGNRRELLLTLRSGGNDDGGGDTFSKAGSRWKPQSDLSKRQQEINNQPDLRRALRHQRRVLSRVIPHVVGDALDSSAQFYAAAKTSTMATDHCHGHQKANDATDETTRLSSDSCACTGVEETEVGGTIVGKDQSSNNGDEGDTKEKVALGDQQEVVAHIQQQHTFPTSAVPYHQQQPMVAGVTPMNSQLEQYEEDREEQVLNSYLTSTTPMSHMATGIRNRRSDLYLTSNNHGHRPTINDHDIDADMFTFHEGHTGADMGLFTAENRGVLVAPSQIMTSTAVALLQTQAAENQNDLDRYMLPVVTSDDLLLVKKESVLRALTLTPPLTTLAICHNYVLRHLPMELIHHVSEHLLSLDLSFNQLQYVPLELLYKPVFRDAYNRQGNYTIAEEHRLGAAAAAAGGGDVDDLAEEMKRRDPIHTRGSVFVPPFGVMTSLSLGEGGFTGPMDVVGIRRKRTRAASVLDTRKRSGASPADVFSDMYVPAFPRLQTLLLNNNVIEGMLPHQMFSFNVMPALSHLNVENNLIVGFSSTIMNAIASRNVLSNVRFANNAFPSVPASGATLATSGVVTAANNTKKGGRDNSIQSYMGVGGGSVGGPLVVDYPARTAATAKGFPPPPPFDFVDDDEKRNNKLLEKWKNKVEAAVGTEGVEGCLLRVTALYEAAMREDKKRAEVVLIKERIVAAALAQQGDDDDDIVHQLQQDSSTLAAQQKLYRQNRQNLASLPEVRIVRSIVDPTHELALPILPFLEMASNTDNTAEQQPPTTPLRQHHASNKNGGMGPFSSRLTIAAMSRDGGGGNNEYPLELNTPTTGGGGILLSNRSTQHSDFDVDSLATSSSVPTTAAHNIVSPVSMGGTVSFLQKSGGDNINENDAVVSNFTNYNNNLLAASTASSHKSSIMEQEKLKMQNKQRRLTITRITSLHGKLQQEILDRGVGSVDEFVESLGSVRLPISVPATKTLLTTLQELVVNAADGDNHLSTAELARGDRRRSSVIPEGGGYPVESAAAVTAAAACALKQELLNQPNKDDVLFGATLAPDSIAASARAQKPIEKRLRQQLGVPRCSMCDVSLVDVWCRFIRDSGLTGAPARDVFPSPTEPQPNAQTTTSSPFGENCDEGIPGSDTLIPFSKQRASATPPMTDCFSIPLWKKSSRRAQNSGIFKPLNKEGPRSNKRVGDSSANSNNGGGGRGGYSSSYGHSRHGPPATRFTPNINQAEDSLLNAADIANINAASTISKNIHANTNTAAKISNFFDETTSEDEDDEQQMGITGAGGIHSSDCEDGVTSSTTSSSSTFPIDEQGEDNRHTWPSSSLATEEDGNIDDRPRRHDRAGGILFSTTPPSSKRVSSPPPLSPRRKARLTIKGIHRHVRGLRSRLRGIGTNQLREAKYLQQQVINRRRIHATPLTAQPTTTTAPTSSSSSAVGSNNNKLPLQRSTDLVVFMALLRHWDSLCRNIAAMDNTTHDHRPTPLNTPTNTQAGGKGGFPRVSSSLSAFQNSSSSVRYTTHVAPQQSLAHNGNTHHQHDGYRCDTGVIFGFDFDRCPDADAEADIEAQLASERYANASPAKKAALAAEHRQKWLYRLLFHQLSKFSLYDVTPCPPFALTKTIERLTTNGGGLPPAAGDTAPQHTADNTASTVKDDDGTKKAAQAVDGVHMDTTLLDRLNNARKKKQQRDNTSLPEEAIPALPRNGSGGGSAATATTVTPPTLVYLTCGRAECVEELIDIIATEGDTGADFSKLAYKPAQEQHARQHQKQKHHQHTTWPSPISPPTSRTTIQEEVPLPSRVVAPHEGGSHTTWQNEGVVEAKEREWDEDTVGGGVACSSPSSSGFDDTTSSSIGEWEEGIDNYSVPPSITQIDSFYRSSRLLGGSVGSTST